MSEVFAKAFKFVFVNKLLVSKALFNSAKLLELVVCNPRGVRVFIIFIFTFFLSLVNFVVFFKNLNFIFILLLKLL